jgi:ubiquinol-cytochrome c reductase cytochrome c1 subunit
MKKTLILVAGLMLPVMGFAAGGGASFPNDDITIDWDDKASMQRGVRTYVNYCMGCHEVSYSRYNRVGADLEIDDDQLMENLIFTTDKYGDKTKVGALMTNAMNADYAAEAFGIVPPDLSLIARSRGVDWLYNYLRGFYVDESRPYGMNNGVFEKVGMPHVLAELQGYQVPKMGTRVNSDGEKYEVIVGFDIVKPGSLSPSEYDQTIHDLVGFLDYVSEPYRQTRQNVGTGVLIFLFLFLILAYFLKKEFWKDIH